jgi:glycosyl transferase, family 25
MTLPNIPIYVLSLVDQLERRRTMTEKLQALNLSFQFFDSIDARKTKVTDHAVYNQTKRLLYFGRDMTAGEIGCLLTHKAIIQKIANDTAHKFSLVLEDDAILDPLVPSIMEKLYQSDFQFDLIRMLGSRKVSKLKQKDIFWITDTHRVTKLYTAPGGAHAYFLTSAGAKKLLKALDDIYIPIDTLMGHSWLTHISNYTIQPGLSIQDLDLESSIGEQRFDKGKNDLKPWMKIIYAFTRSFYKISTALMKMLSYYYSK